MPYQSNKDLPKGAQHVLPPHAQDIYREAYKTAPMNNIKIPKKDGTMPPLKKCLIGWAVGSGSKKNITKVPMETGLKMSECFLKCQYEKKHVVGF